VIGGGKSGIAAARLLARLGSKVLLSEKESVASTTLDGVETEVGGHSDRLLECGLIIRSPGVPGHLPILDKIRRRRVPIWSELELASRLVAPKRLVAITGTNGKTTTTTLVGELFKGARYETIVAGNIGTPLSDLVGDVSRRSSVVLEVSSYQLEDIDAFHPTISAILNVTPDHLEHHGTMQAYAAAKARIFENQRTRDICVLNADDVSCRRLAKKSRARVFWFSRNKPLKSGVYFEDGQVVVRWGRLRESWPLRWQLPGPHNIENGLAAIAIALAAGIPVRTIRQVFEAFKGVEHRLEIVRELDGVRYVNDSKGTNVDSTRVALESFKEPLIVIMGGQGKGSPYDPLLPLVKERVRRLLLIGEDTPKIRAAFDGTVPCEDLGTLDRAVARARAVAEPGSVVLLSPACASFDQYKNYEERGRHFKTLVQSLH
jgi:UDP-N-acetylmuramoylalanine--D-glutamate ligase